MRDWSKYGALYVDWQGEESISTNWPDPETLPARTHINDLFDDLPSDPGKAREEVERRLRSRRGELEKDYSRYNVLREKGSKALSESDIHGCNGGNAARALGQALVLKTNHITFGHRLIQEYERYLAGEIEGLEVQLGLPL